MSQKWKVLLAFTGIFVAGAVAGGIVALRVGAENAEKAAAQSPNATPPPPARAVVGPDNFSVVQMGRLVAQLGLSPAQSDKIQPIITGTGDQLKKLSQDSAAQTKALLDKMDKEVEVLLDPVQRKKLTDIEKQRQNRFDQNKNHPPGPNSGLRRNGPPGPPVHRGGPDEDGPPLSAPPAPANQLPQQ